MRFSSVSFTVFEPVNVSWDMSVSYNITIWENQYFDKSVKSEK